MSLSADSAPKLQAYAHPERLVTTDWLAEHLDDENLVVIESNEDVLLYRTGHIPGAYHVDWHLDLNDDVMRDYVSSEAFAAMCSARGITRDSTVVVYGDNFNWWAAYALWVFSLFGHPDVRLLDGGRAKWAAEGRPMTTDAPTVTPSQYPVVPRDDSTILHMPDYPQEGVQRGGHVPTAQSVPWKRAANEDGSFKSADELRGIYEGELGMAPSDDVVTYCRIGERSSHTWFVLTYLLGFEHVRNYDGSWVEWGNAVRVPIEKPA